MRFSRTHLAYTVAFAVTFILLGCTVADYDESPEQFTRVSQNVIQDTETGCRYLYYREGGGRNATVGVTALLDANGRPQCSNTGDN